MKASYSNVNSSVMALPPGQKLLWYEIESVLDRGGFGIVYLAWDTNLQKRVAIKEFVPSHIESRRTSGPLLAIAPDHEKLFHQGLKTFLNEARTLCKFKHPNIVSVHAVFNANNTAYMVMDFLPGRDLEDALKFKKVEGEFEFKRIIGVLIDVLELLHCEGFVHRDLTPRNVFLRDEREPVLLDFGSSRWAPIQTLRPLTTIFSPGYAAHEQHAIVRGASGQGPWTDIYSLGAILYRAICGRPPIDSVSRAHALLEGADCLMPAREIGKGHYSASFLAAIDWALGIRPKDRPQTIRQWRNALFAGSASELDFAPSSNALSNLPADLISALSRNAWGEGDDLLAAAYRPLTKSFTPNAFYSPLGDTDAQTRTNPRLSADKPKAIASQTAGLDTASTEAKKNFRQTIKEQAA